MSLNNSILVGLVVTIALLFGYIALQADRAGTIKQNYEVLEQRISDLEAQSQELATQYQEAQQQADSKEQRSQVETQNIIVANVPKSCEKAILWAIDQSKVFT